MGIGISLRGEECESSGHDQVSLLFRITDSDIQTTFPASTSATSYFSGKGNYASSTRCYKLVKTTLVLFAFVY